MGAVSDAATLADSDLDRHLKKGVAGQAQVRESGETMRALPDHGDGLRFGPADEGFPQQGDTFG